MDQGLLKFWKNYEDVIDWGYRVSEALEVNARGSTDEQVNDVKNLKIDDEYDEDVRLSDDSIDIDLEYLKFSKKTLEHQEQIEREKKRVDKEYGLCSSSSITEDEIVESSFEERIKPEELYGSKVDEIKCLEKKLLSEFNTFCSMKTPVLWPSMAFNLSVPGNFNNLLN